MEDMRYICNACGKRFPAIPQEEVEAFVARNNKDGSYSEMYLAWLRIFFCDDCIKTNTNKEV